MARPPYTILVACVLGLLLQIKAVSHIRYGNLSDLAWASSPYAVCLVVSMFRRLQIGAFVAACAVLVFSVVVYRPFTMKPGDFVDGYTILLAPLCSAVFVIPGALLVTWAFGALWRRRPKKMRPDH